jgi:hypothetical protein
MGELRLKVGALIGVLAVLAIAEPALAQHQHKQKCEKAAKEAEEACKAAKNAAESKGNAHNASGTGQDAASGANSDRGSNNLCPRIQDQKNNLDNAKNSCVAAQAKCQTTCKDEKTQDDAHGQQFMMTMRPHPKEGVDPNVCNKELPNMIQALASAAAPLAGQAQQACKSGEQSKGQPPQIPPITPPPKEEKKEDPQQQQKQALQCSSPEGARYSDCNSYYIGQCSANLQGANCNEFSERYCGNAGGGSQADVAVAGGKSASVVLDKKGEGLGSGFCKTYSAYQFCQKTANQQCPSCRGTHEYSSPTCQADPSKCIGSSLSAAQSKCPSDPMFMDPAVQKQIAEAQGAAGGTEFGSSTSSGLQTASTAAAAAAGAAGGSGSSLGGSTAVANPGGYNGTSREALPAGTAVAMEHGGGGGFGGDGGDGSGSSNEDGTRGPAGLNPQSAGSGASSIRLPGDISYQYGPNVFAISTTVYRSMCGRGALTRCGGRK